MKSYNIIYLFILILLIIFSGCSWLPKHSYHDKKCVNGVLYQYENEAWIEVQLVGRCLSPEDIIDKKLAKGL